MENNEYTYIIIDDSENKEEVNITLNDYYDTSVSYDYKSHIPVGGDFLYEIVEDASQDDNKETNIMVDYSYL